MAMGFRSHLGGDQVEVRSAGTAPAERVNQVAVSAMLEIGIDIAAERPKIGSSTNSSAITRHGPLTGSDKRDGQRAAGVCRRVRRRHRRRAPRPRTRTTHRGHRRARRCLPELLHLRPALRDFWRSRSLSRPGAPNHRRARGDRHRAVHDTVARSIEVAGHRLRITTPDGREDDDGMVVDVRTPTQPTDFRRAK